MVSTQKKTMYGLQGLPDTPSQEQNRRRLGLRCVVERTSSTGGPRTHLGRWRRRSRRVGGSRGRSCTGLLPWFRRQSRWTVQTHKPRANFLSSEYPKRAADTVREKNSVRLHRETLKMDKPVPQLGPIKFKDLLRVLRDR